MASRRGKGTKGGTNVVQRASSGALAKQQRTVGSLIDRAQVSEETRRLARELVSILRGKSNLRLDPADPRFKDPAWSQHPVFRRLGQAYVAFCKAVEGSRREDLDEQDRERWRLLADVLVSTLSPTNLIFTNPTALKHARATRGRSLLAGARNFIRDVRKNGGMPTQVNREPFAVGRNLAITPGAVVFRNEMVEVLQYRPSTPQVHERPLLVIAPQLNKYYFLDLAPGRSFVEYAVSQGIQTFVTSWRSADPSHARWRLDDYLSSLLEATDAVRRVAGTDDLNTFGFCAGGLMMTALLAHLSTIRDARVHSASYAVTLVDFGVPSLIGALRWDPLLHVAQRSAERAGVYAGCDLAKVFAWLRPNDLVWSYWVNNYLLGQEPTAFDILAWNADSANLPADLFHDYLKIFRNNPMVRPGALRVLGSPVDLSKIGVESFVIGAVADHLTPWTGCYRTTQLLGGRSTFVLSNSGHIAGLVNPPGNPKSRHWTGPSPEGLSAQDWFAQAQQQPGSWWECWAPWIVQRSGARKAAPKRLGSRAFPVLGEAPGTYIRA